MYQPVWLEERSQVAVLIANAKGLCCLIEAKVIASAARAVYHILCHIAAHEGYRDRFVFIGGFSSEIGTVTLKMVLLVSLIEEALDCRH